MNTQNALSGNVTISLETLNSLMNRVKELESLASSKPVVELADAPVQDAVDVELLARQSEFVHAMHSVTEGTFLLARDIRQLDRYIQDSPEASIQRFVRAMHNLTDMGSGVSVIGLGLALDQAMDKDFDGLTLRRSTRKHAQAWLWGVTPTNEPEMRP